MGFLNIDLQGYFVFMGRFSASFNGNQNLIDELITSVVYLTIRTDVSHMTNTVAADNGIIQSIQIYYNKLQY